MRNGEPRKGTIIGSPLYMPPELIEEGEASCAPASLEPDSRPCPCFGDGESTCVPPFGPPLSYEQVPS